MNRDKNLNKGRLAPEGAPPDLGTLLVIIPVLKGRQALMVVAETKILKKIEYANSCSGASRYVRDRVEKDHGKKILDRIVSLNGQMGNR